MSQKYLTVVVPVYNMEKLLTRCLDSLLILDNEDLFKKLEVIVVNDGSKDKSLHIARKYELKYPEVYKVIDKPNGNYGSCINVGIKNATGKYFRILDADDFFKSAALVNILKNIDKFLVCPDLLITNYQEDYSIGYSRCVENVDYEYNRIYPFAEVDFRDQSNGVLAVMHRMTYSLDVIRNSHLLHLEGISYTDSEYCFYPLISVQSVMFLDECLYCYQIGREGQTVSEVSYQKNIHQLYLIIDRMLNSFQEESKSMICYQNQLVVLKLCLYIYYRAILTTKFDHKEDIYSLDSRIKRFDGVLYEDLAQFKKLHYIPFVKWWRKGVSTNCTLFRGFYKCFDFVVRWGKILFFKLSFLGR